MHVNFDEVHECQDEGRFRGVDLGGAWGLGTGSWGLGGWGWGVKDEGEGLEFGVFSGLGLGFWMWGLTSKVSLSLGFGVIGSGLWGLELTIWGFTV